MVRARREALQVRARHAPDGDVGVARYLNNLSQTRLVRALCQSQALDGPRARAQGFEHGLNAEDVRAVVISARPPCGFVVRAERLRAVRPLFASRAGFFTPRTGLFNTHT
jgi:hypothetical protein